VGNQDGDDARACLFRRVLTLLNDKQSECMMKDEAESRTESVGGRNLLPLLREVLALVRPYGRRKLVALGVLILLQALAQMASVAGMLPFLNVLVDDGKRSRGLGAWLTSFVPKFEGMSPLVVSGLFAVMVLILANMVGFYTGWMKSRVSWQVSHFLRSSLMREMMSRPYEWHTRQNSSVLAKKALSDCQVFTIGILIPFFECVSSLFAMLALGGFVIALDWKIGILGFGIFGAIYTLFFLILNPRRTRISDQMKSETRDIFQRVGEVFSGFKLILVYGREQRFLERVEDTSQRYCELATKSDVLKMSSRFVLEPIIALLVIVFLFMVQRTEGGVMGAVPTLGVSAVALLRLLPAFRSLYTSLTSIGTNRFAVQELSEELKGGNSDRAVAWAKSKVAVEGDWEKIEFREVSFHYEGAEEDVLQKVSFSLNRGQSLAVQGASGSGKSTAVDLLMGLLKPTRGGIFIDNKSLEEQGMIRWWQSGIGYVPQDGHLIDGTIEENIAFGSGDEKNSIERMRACAEKAQIASFVEEKLVEGYQTWVGERGVRLSGGQRQRILLARALYVEPDLLILDEATSALDAETEGRFLDTVFKLSDDLTIVLISHDPDVSRRAEMILDVRTGEFLRPV